MIQSGTSVILHRMSLDLKKFETAVLSVVRVDIVSETKCQWVKADFSSMMIINHIDC